jgi:16S rRNA (cytidine1402-2'-O)-methyltransferase
VALVSDAGTPGISDPAYLMVRQAIDSQISVVPIPGVTAAISAIVASGLPTDRFIFEGFLPAKKGRNKRLASLSAESRTLIFYESPHRLIRTLKDIKNHLGDRRVTLCRELTKKFEEFLRGSISEMIEHYTGCVIRGEFVIIVQGYEKKSKTHRA